MANEANSKMGALILVTGIPGVGKTTLLDEFNRMATRRGLNVTIMNYGTIMSSILKEKSSDLARDEIRRQKTNTQKIAQLRTAELIANKSNDGITMIDTHTFINTKAGFLAGLPYDVLKKLNPSLLVLVEASIRDILKRRSLGSIRNREKQSLEEIKLGLEWSRNMASAYSALIGLPIKILKNEEGKQKEAAKSLLSLVSEEFGE